MKMHYCNYQDSIRSFLVNQLIREAAQIDNGGRMATLSAKHREAVVLALWRFVAREEFITQSFPDAIVVLNNFSDLFIGESVK